MKKSLTIALFLSAFWSNHTNAATVTHNFAVRLGIFDASRTQFTYELRGKDYRVQSEVSTNGIFDIIISNPPYIPEGTPLEPEVRHEPPGALFAEENGFKIYRQIIEQAHEFLKPNGWLMFELGIGESSQVKRFMEKDFSDIVVEKDLAGIDRIIYGKLKY